MTIDQVKRREAAVWFKFGKPGCALPEEPGGSHADPQIPGWVWVLSLQGAKPSTCAPVSTLPTKVVHRHRGMTQSSRVLLFEFLLRTLCLRPSAAPCPLLHWPWEVAFDMKHVMVSGLLIPSAGPVRAWCRWNPMRSGWRWQSLTGKRFCSEEDLALWSFPLPPASSSTPGTVRPHPPQGWALVKIQATPRKMLAPPLELPVWSVLVLMVATFLQVRRQESARDWEAGRAESDSWPSLGHLGLKLQLLAFSVTWAIFSP